MRRKGRKTIEMRRRGTENNRNEDEKEEENNEKWRGCGGGKIAEIRRKETNKNVVVVEGKWKKWWKWEITELWRSRKESRLVKSWLKCQKKRFCIIMLQFSDFESRAASWKRFLKNKRWHRSNISKAQWLNLLKIADDLILMRFIHILLIKTNDYDVIDVNVFHLKLQKMRSKTSLLYYLKSSKHVTRRCSLIFFFSLKGKVLLLVGSLPNVIRTYSWKILLQRKRNASAKS